MTRHRALAASLAFCLWAAAPAANATTVLVFGQTSDANDLFATNPTASSTQLSATNVGVTITSYLEGGTPIPAFFNFSALDTGAATTFMGSEFQTFAGSFSITSGMGDTGTDYLSGTFSDLTAAQGSSASIRSSTPGEVVTFQSSLIPPNSLSNPLALALSFANVTPPASSLCGPAGAQTICAFSASVSGTFSANTVTPIPEPGTMALLGAGLLGIGLIRRRSFK